MTPSDMREYGGFIMMAIVSVAVLVTSLVMWSLDKGDQTIVMSLISMVLGVWIPSPVQIINRVTQPAQPQPPPPVEDQQPA